MRIDAIYPYELYVTLMSFILDVVESIQEGEYSNQTIGADNIKKDPT